MSAYCQPPLRVLWAGCQHEDYSHYHSYSAMAPTQRDTSEMDAKPVEQTHSVSAASMVILVLCLISMAAMAVVVAVRHRAAVKARRRKKIQTREEPAPTSTFWSLCRARYKKRRTATPQDSATIVGALHATTILAAAAPTKIFATPIAMHFKLPLEDKSVLIFGIPCVPIPCELRDSANLSTYPNHARLGGQRNCASAAPLLFATSMHAAPQDCCKESFRDQLYDRQTSTMSAQSLLAGSQSHRR